MWKALLAAVALTPIAALFLGVAILAQDIGATWTSETTAALVAGLVAVCGGGFVVIALIVALVVGIPMSIRYFHEAGVSRRAWDAPTVHGAGGRYLPHYREPLPPQLTAGRGGSWQSRGAAAYDVWQEEEPADPGQGRSW